MCILPPNRDEALKPLDTKLRQMIEDAKQFPEGSSERRKAVSRLIKEMNDSRKIGLKCPSDMRHEKLESEQNQQTYEEALQVTWVWFGKNCCRFDPNDSKNPETWTVLGWFRYFLKLNKRNSDTRWIERMVKTTSQNKSVLDENNGSTDIDSIDEQIAKETKRGESIPAPNLEVYRRQLITAMRQCIQKCSTLRNLVVPQRPDVNCQILLLLLLPEWNDKSQEWIPEKSWEDLEQKFNLSSQKLKNCYSRHLTNGNCSRCLQDCLKDWKTD